MLEGLSVADGAAILVGAKDGVQVGTEKVWDAVEQKKYPECLSSTSLMKKTQTFKVFNELKDKFGNSVIATQIPLVENGKITGIIDIPRMKAVTFSGKEVQEKDVPDSLKDEAESYRKAYSRR